jgi:hypothetical protein
LGFPLRNVDNMGGILSGAFLSRLEVRDRNWDVGLGFDLGLLEELDGTRVGGETTDDVVAASRGPIDSELILV